MRLSDGADTLNKQRDTDEKSNKTNETDAGWRLAIQRNGRVPDALLQLEGCIAVQYDRTGKNEDYEAGQPGGQCNQQSNQADKYPNDHIDPGQYGGYLQYLIHDPPPLSQCTAHPIVY